MTSMLPIDGGLRHAKNVLIFHDIVHDYVLPAIDADVSDPATQAQREALREEMAKSLTSHPEPGVFIDPTDRPRLGTPT